MVSTRNLEASMPPKGKMYLVQNYPKLKKIIFVKRIKKTRSKCSAQRTNFRNLVITRLSNLLAGEGVHFIATEDEELTVFY